MCGECGGSEKVRSSALHCTMLLKLCGLQTGRNLVIRITYLRKVFKYTMHWIAVLGFLVELNAWEHVVLSCVVCVCNSLRPAWN